LALFMASDQCVNKSPPCFRVAEV